MRSGLLLRFILMCCPMAFVMPSAMSAPSPSTMPPALDKQITSLLKKYGIPGASLAVVSHGKYFMHSGINIGYLTILIGSIDGKNGAAIMINISPEWNAKDYPQFGFIKDSLKLIGNYYHWR